MTIKTGQVWLTIIMDIQPAVGIQMMQSDLEAPGNGPLCCINWNIL